LTPFDAHAQTWLSDFNGFLCAAAGGGFEANSKRPISSKKSAFAFMPSEPDATGLRKESTNRLT